MATPLRLLNKKFGKLTVLRQTAERRNGAIMWECMCDCGRTKEARGSHLIAGLASSCGCIFRQKVKTTQALNSTGHNGIAKTKCGTFHVRMFGVIVGTFENINAAIAARNKFEIDRIKPPKQERKSRSAHKELPVRQADKNPLWSVKW